MQSAPADYIIHENIFTDCQVSVTQYLRWQHAFKEKKESCQYMKLRETKIFEIYVHFVGVQ
jgi:hypothetical protein